MALPACMPFASSTVHVFATCHSFLPLQCSQALALAQLRTTQPQPQPGMFFPAVSLLVPSFTVRLHLPLSALSAPLFILPPPCPLSSGLNSVLQQACGWSPVAWTRRMPTRHPTGEAAGAPKPEAAPGGQTCCSRPPSPAVVHEGSPTQTPGPSSSVGPVEDTARAIREALLAEAPVPCSATSRTSISGPQAANLREVARQTSSYHGLPQGVPHCSWSSPRQAAPKARCSSC